MANDLGQPTAEEIAEKFCTEMLCNALLCDGCPIQAIQHTAQLRVQADKCRTGLPHVFKWDGTLDTPEMLECENCGIRR